MRRTLWSVLTLVGAGLTFMASPGSAAGAVTWVDPPGDATGIDPLPPAASESAPAPPRPQDDGLDLLAASVASDGTAITFSARTATDAIPPGATGATVRFVFSYDGIAYQFIAQRTAPDFSSAITSGVFLRSREPSSPELACRDCTVKYDPKASSVMVRAPISSLTSAIRSHAANSPKFGSGAKLTDLFVLAQRNVAPLARDVDVGRTVTVDVASADAATLSV